MEQLNFFTKAKEADPEAKERANKIKYILQGICETEGLPIMKITKENVNTAFPSKENYKFDYVQVWRNCKYFKEI